MSNENEQKEMARELIENAKIKIHLKENSGEPLALMAMATVHLGEIIEINGFTIKKSKKSEEPWIQQPAYGRNYNSAFWIKEKKVWSGLIKRIERAYYQETENKEALESLEDIGF